MKKIVLLLSVVALAFMSCSKNEDETVALVVDTNEVLLKKMAVTDIDGTITTNYVYNGNKLVSATDNDGYQENYTYTGNLITSTQEIDNGGVTNNTFEYNANGDLIFFKRFDGATGEEFSRDGYVYNLDGTITVNRYTNLTGVPSIWETDKLYLENGEIIKVIKTNLTLGSSNTRNYTYDAKNNPYKNILGFTKVIYGEGDLMYGGRLSNCLTDIPVGSGNSDTYGYSYNSSNFPITGTYTSTNGENATYAYFYE
jgi:hypothetical protein